MSRNRHSETYSPKKGISYSKGGYKLNKNGMPLDSNDAPVMKTANYHYLSDLHRGIYRPTVHNISEI